MNPFMNMNFAIPQPNMNYNQDMYHQFRNMYNNMPHNNMDFNQNMYQQFMNQNRMNMYRQNNNINQLFYMFLQWMNNYYGNNNMNNLNNENNCNINLINNNNGNHDNINNNFNRNDGNNRNEGDNTGLREILPRGDNMLKFENEYPGEESENLRNVIFKTSSGFKVTIVVPYYETVSNLLRLFVKKLGIGENSLENDIFFIFDATYVKPDDQRAIYELTQSNIPTITVIDSGNVLGA
jgi:hypothetical protein